MREKRTEKGKQHKRAPPQLFRAFFRVQEFEFRNESTNQSIDHVAPELLVLQGSLISTITQPIRMHVVPALNRRLV